PDVRASLASIIDRCLAKDPAHRFQTCDELDAALAAAQTDANRVTTRPPTPLISDTEAHAVFKRAAELQDMTGVQSRPVLAPKPRDAAADAGRSEGFKTSNLREAAAEAGIDAAFVEHALVEQGLRPIPRREDTPERRPPNVIHDMTAPPRFFG